MSQRLKNRSRVPYGGTWHLNKPDRGLVGSGYLFDLLRKNIAAYRQVNNIPIGLGFDDEIEQALCEDFPSECSDEKFVKPRRLEFGDVFRGAKVMMALKTSGVSLVDKAEAERRASICDKCPNNRGFTKPCAGICEKLKRLVKELIGHERTSFDDDNKACSICSCFTRSHVWLPLDILDKGLTETMREKFKEAQQQHNCWKVMT